VSRRGFWTTFWSSREQITSHGGLLAYRELDDVPPKYR
jgi:hypothetical protein